MEDRQFRNVNWDTFGWNCHYCSQKFYDYKHLKSHLLTLHNITNSEESYYQCIDCTAPLLGYTSFINHIRSVHHENLRLCCDVCSELFSDYKQLSVHRDIHNETLSEVYPIVYHCTLCEYVLSTEKELKTHIKQMHKLIYPGKPNEVLKSNYSGENNVKSQRSFNTEHLEIPLELIQCKEEFNETEPIFQCGKCAKSFANDSKLQVHIKTHKQKGPFKCEFCFKLFSFECHLKRHMRAHTGERPYKCKYCSKTLSYLSNLTYHLRMHTGERPYKCKLCPKNFNSKEALKTHRRIHSNERPFQCEHCEKSFKSNDEKKKHIKVSHSDNRPYLCSICSKSFKKISNMKDHMRVHSDVRPFQCERCERCFKTIREKERHFKICKNPAEKNTAEERIDCDERPSECKIFKEDLPNVHPDDRQYNCETCSKPFQSSSVMKRHTKICKGLPKKNTSDDNMNISVN